MPILVLLAVKEKEGIAHVPAALQPRLFLATANLKLEKTYLERTASATVEDLL